MNVREARLVSGGGGMVDHFCVKCIEMFDHFVLKCLMSFRRSVVSVANMGI